MKVSGVFPQIKSVDRVQAKKVKDSAQVKTEVSASVTGTDRVELSTSSAEVQKMRRILQETSSVRTEKIQALKERIDQDEYQIDPYKVADKMMMSLLSETVFE
ncbi:MAG: flagellar biosynthesis anti-sigma factor FlgM [Desulfobulbaceae bacterium]|nr:flagellar biosynthesis anti-sigma factor FlgM [Desulfobulbaceae bacterium]MCK5437057.1 flagellar biosynthesis anti-sigma factor FlgM [Desulfobulbaceae bacterium]